MPTGLMDGDGTGCGESSLDPNQLELMGMLGRHRLACLLKGDARTAQGVSRWVVAGEHTQEEVLNIGLGGSSAGGLLDQCC